MGFSGQILINAFFSEAVVCSYLIKNSSNEEDQSRRKINR
jgi:hypothetical protein